MASEIMPPSIDTKRFHCKWEQYGPSWFNNLKRPLRIFALGVLISRKGFIHLVDAMPAVLEQTDCELIIGGDGPERARILERASQLGIADRVHLLGKVSTDEVPRLMCEADVFVLPSVPESSGYNETLGVVLLEALASGTPCVASRTGGIPDAVEDGVDGYLVTPGDSNELATCIIRLLRDEDLRERMGQAGRQKVEQRFSLQPIVRRTIAVYEQLLL
jgi:glycosyltransferase involved in cell wall biosynthesis